jgi:hypothetical protein
LGAVLFTGTAQQASAQAAPQPGAAAAAQSEKKPKDTAEYDLIRAVMGEAQAPATAQKAIADLNTWTQKYPQTDFADERTFWYLQAYSNANQQDKVLEYGAQLLAKDLNTVFKAQQNYILETLYRTANALTQLKTPTPAQLETGTKAANQLKQFVPVYFVPANKPAAAADAAWAQAKEQIEGIANQALLYAAVLPADQAAAKGDFKGAEAGYKTALQ